MANVGVQGAVKSLTIYRDSYRVTGYPDSWHQDEFPFLIVQLPNFGKPKPEPSESEWAELREAQLKALALPNTGLAVTIDVGEAYKNDRSWDFLVW